MFTGLVEAQGTIARLVSEGAGLRLVIAIPAEMRSGAAIGDSVAINGCCLTVVECAGETWAFQAGPETLIKTNLGKLSPGDRVNLERSLPVNARLGGHFVQGHVDGTGTVERVDSDGEWTTINIRAAPEQLRQMVSKGSIAVDGVSLTLVNVDRERFSIALIPHTLQATTLGTRRPGDTVNLETDILGKYVEKLLRRE